MSKDSSLTPRQRFWIEHLSQCATRGQSLSAYAAEHGLKIGSLYEAKSRMRRHGLCSASSTQFVRMQPVPPDEIPPPTVFAFTERRGGGGRRWRVVRRPVGSDAATMIRPSSTLAAMYLCVEPIDFRLQIDGLAARVESALLFDPLSEQLFAFTNRRYNVSG